LRPSEKRALELWDSLPEGERSYRNVADRYTKDDGTSITEGRAAGYVREALTKTGRTDELPRRSNGERTTATTTAQPQSAEDMLRAEVAKLRKAIEAQEQRATTAREAADAFDADAFREAEQTRRQEAVKEAQARLKRWKDDTDGEASKAAEQAEAALNEQAERVEATVQSQTESMRSLLAGYEQAIQAVEAAMTE
jgi:hypothetical protein